MSRRVQPVLLPELQRELLDAAHRALERERRRLVGIRSVAAVVSIAILLLAPSSAAVSVSPAAPAATLTAHG